MSEDSIKINKKSLKGFLVGVVIAAPIFIGGTYLFSDKIDSQNPNTNTNPDTNPPVVQGEPEFKIDKNSHTLGNTKAKVQLVVYSDFECPFCSKHHDTIKQIANEYGDKVFIVFRNFPLSFHQYAGPAAEAAECASEQGKFWEYTDSLFANQADFADEPWVDLAVGLGLDTDKFQTCIDSDKFKNRVSADLNEGFDNGVEGTPATFINSELVSGALPFENFKQIIDSILE